MKKTLLTLIATLLGVTLLGPVQAWAVDLRFSIAVAPDSVPAGTGIHYGFQIQNADPSDRDTEISDVNFWVNFASPVSLVSSANLADATCSMTDDMTVMCAGFSFTRSTFFDIEVMPIDTTDLSEITAYGHVAVSGDIDTTNNTATASAVSSIPLPDGCREEACHSVVETEGSLDNCRRHICGPYFYQDSALEIMDNGETEDRGEAGLYRVIHVRFPTREFAAEPFQRVLLPPVPTVEELGQQCGTTRLSLTELDQLLNEESERSFSFWLPLEEILISTAFADGNLRYRYQVSDSTLYPEFPFFFRDLFSYDFYVATSNFQTAIDSGDYGIEGSFPRFLAQRTVDAIRWANYALTVAYISNEFTFGPEEIPLSILGTPVPSVRMGHFAGLEQPAGLYQSADNKVYLNENLIESLDEEEISYNPEFETTTLHELVHAVNRHVGYAGTSENDFSGWLIDEWLASIAENALIFYGSILIGESEREQADHVLQVIRDAPLNNLVEEGLNRLDVMLPALPPEFIRRRLADLPSTLVESSDDSWANSDVDDFCFQNLNGGSGPYYYDNSYYRIYDFLFPECCRHMETIGNPPYLNIIPNCPDPLHPEEWPDDQRLRLYNALKRDLAEHTDSWEPYVHKIVADFEAAGGLATMDGRIPGSLGGINSLHPSLHHDHIASQLRAGPGTPEGIIAGPPPDIGSTYGGGDASGRQTCNGTDCTPRFDSPFDSRCVTGVTAEIPGSCYDQCWEANVVDGDLCDRMRSRDRIDGCTHSSGANQETCQASVTEECIRIPNPDDVASCRNSCALDSSLSFCGTICFWDPIQPFCPDTGGSGSGSGDSSGGGGSGGSSGETAGTGSAASSIPWRESDFDGDGLADFEEDSDDDNDGLDDTTDPDDDNDGMEDDEDYFLGDEPFTPGSTRDECVIVDEYGNESCVSPCMCDINNPWWCQPSPTGSAYYSCPIDDEPPADFPNGESRMNCSYATRHLEEWMNATTLRCGTRGYCGTEWIWTVEDPSLCVGTFDSDPLGLIQESVDGCFPYVGPVMHYSGPAGDRTFHTGTNQACRTYCGCDERFPDSCYGSCINPNDGYETPATCYMTSAGICYCEFVDICSVDRS